LAVMQAFLTASRFVFSSADSRGVPIILLLNACQLGSYP
jgi:hypothetical protein